MTPVLLTLDVTRPMPPDNPPEEDDPDEPVEAPEPDEPYEVPGEPTDVPEAD